MKIAINKVHWPVTVLGYGSRIGIWVQGCTLGCAGCCSRDTWKVTPSHLIPLKDLIDRIEKIDLTFVDGFTISGGEPFNQPDELKELLTQLTFLAQNSGQGKDILVYSGYAFTYLKKKYKDICDLCDLIISGPYRSKIPGNGPIGSGNQKSHLLTDLARKRYSSPILESSQPKLQVEFDGKQIWMIGIPKKDDLKRLEMGLKKKGINIDRVSWRR